MTPPELKKLLKDMNLTQVALAEMLRRNKFCEYRDSQYSQAVISKLLAANCITERFRNHVRVALQQYVDLLQKLTNEI
jgi:hypothetical protein